MAVEEDAGRFRLRIFAFVALILFGALFTRLWFLQGIESAELQQEAEALVLREVYEQAPRGRILDRNGKVIVDNKVVDVVTLDKTALKELSTDEQNDLFLRLATAISRSGRLTKVSTIEREVRSDQYGSFDVVPIAVDVDPDLMIYLGERPDEFPGVEVVSRTVRTYPYGTVAAHLLGYVGSVTLDELQSANQRIDPAADDAKTYQLSDEIGKTGVERTFESLLRGVPGVRYVEVNNVGEIIRERTELSRAPVPGADLYLTIDIDLQAAAEEELAASLANVRAPLPGGGEDNILAPAGSVVATDPMTGQLLAMASFPTYDPSEFVNGISFAQFEVLNDPENYQPILNRAIQGSYAPGSTFKPFVAAAALEAGLLGPTSRIVEARDGTIEDTFDYRLPQCRQDFEASDTCVFTSPGVNPGAVTYGLIEAISKSSDVFFYKLGAEGFFPEERGPEGDEFIQTMARRFGMGSTTAVQLPFERAGVIPDRAYLDAGFEQGIFIRDGDLWLAGDTVLLSIGQGGTLVTPMQLTNAYASIANGGQRFQINVALRAVSHDGEEVTEFLPRKLTDVDVDPAHLAEIEQGLLGVPISGTGRTVFEGFPHSTWPVAGKTGTAQVEGKADTSLFAAYGPVLPGRDPEIAISAVLEESGFGSSAAAPLVKNLLEMLATDTLPEARTVDQVATAAANGEGEDGDGETDGDPETGEDTP